MLEAKKKEGNRMRYTARHFRNRAAGWEERRGENGMGRGRGLVSQTVRKRLTPRIKWYRNETIVEQMPGHKTTASSFPSPIAALSTPVEQAN